ETSLFPCPAREVSRVPREFKSVRSNRFRPCPRRACGRPRRDAAGCRRLDEDDRQRRACESGWEFEMKTEIIIPDVGATGGDVRILAWLVKVGDFVSAGTPLVTIETDKATEDIEAFSDGYVEAIVADAGSEVPVGSVIATLRAKQKQSQAEASLVGRAP